jgi:hypothetical protein
MRFLMPSRRKVPEEVRLAIVDAVRHGGRTFDEIPKEYSVSQATVSRIAQAANLSSSHGKRVRSQAGVQADHTYDKEARVGFLDDLLATLQNMTQKSNLSPKDLKEISQAGSAVLSSRHAEDPPESEDEVVQKGDAQIELVEAFGDLKIPRVWPTRWTTN